MIPRSQPDRCKNFPVTAYRTMGQPQQRQFHRMRREGRNLNLVLVDARETLKLTQGEVARLIGIKQCRLGTYETGSCIPAKGIQERICAFYVARGVAITEQEAFPYQLPLRKRYWNYAPDAEPTEEDLVYFSQVRQFSLGTPQNTLSCPATQELDYLRRERTYNIRCAIKAFTEQQRRVVLMRFGMAPYEREHTLEEIAKKHGVTRERIRKIQEEAIHKLQHSMRAKTLRQYLED